MTHRLDSAVAAVAFVAGSACAAQSATPVVAAMNDAASLAVTQEPVTLKTPTGEIHGTLVLPPVKSSVPIALIIAGSGPTDRDGNSAALPGANNSLKMLADGLAARGIASLRYDKRGIAASRAAMTSESLVRFNHYVEDAEGWMRHLRSDKRFSTLTVAGHSEGSLIGMIAAGKGAADAYVSLEGVGRKAQVVLLEQIRPQLPPAVLAQTEHLLAELGSGSIPDSIPPMLAPIFRRNVLPYLISWFKYDPAVEIAKLTIPILIVQGTTDIQTSMTDARALAAGNPGSRLLAIEGMNHILKAVTGDLHAQIPTYSDPTLPVVPTLLDEVAAFVRAAPKRVTWERWLGPDKIKHFFISAFIESLTFSGLQATGASRNTALAGAVATTAAFAIGRELHDKRTKGIFSIPDLTWDAAGGSAALLMLRSTQR